MLAVGIREVEATARWRQLMQVSFRKFIL